MRFLHGFHLLLPSLSVASSISLGCFLSNFALLIPHTQILLVPQQDDIIYRSDASRTFLVCF
jgi:hypothetical protein